MFSSHAAELSINSPCRAVAAIQADKTDSRFLIGSCGVDEGNHLHVIRFHSEINELGIDAKIQHDTGPVQVICSSPSDPSLVVTAADGRREATLWRIPRNIVTCSGGLQYDPDEDDAMNAASSAIMEEVSVFDSQESSPLVDIVWRDAAEDMSSGTDDILTMNLNGQLTQWDTATSTSVRSVSTASNSFKAALLPRVAWDPHTSMAVGVTSGTRVGILDWRVDTSTPTGTVESFQCHRYGVTDLDYNPNKPYVLATSGQDGLVKFWDLRTAKSPLLVARGGHSHWAWNVQYNPFHDQLVLTSGTDAIANLWRLSTISSAPMLTLNDDDGSESSSPNVRVARHEQGDSIYAISWSAADAWVYMIVGYDGKAVLNHVPSKEKYKILL